MVANLAYLESVTHGTGPNVVFAKTGGNAASVARSVAAATASSGVSVKKIPDQIHLTTTSIPTVALTGVSRDAEVFPVCLAGAGLALCMATTTSWVKVPNSALDQTNKQTTGNPTSTNNSMAFGILALQNAPE